MGLLGFKSKSVEICVVEAGAEYEILKGIVVLRVRDVERVAH